ncbi:MAG TPA: sodium/solute symporter [Verrucomicrobiota bacterium]|nr:sodium/solute symporter [Verrucomicrobiota bacterium]HNU50851.1 sodium/solute symporter [Verrucomicrobiota bacterium]
MNTSVGSLDWTIIALYLLAVVALGVAAGVLRRQGERGGEGGHYFLAGNTLTWPVIGLAMFAANISTVHLVSLAEAAYKFGLVFGNFEWMAGFTLILLSLFFAPLYLRSRVATLPDFLERRFNRPCRDVLSVVSLFSAIVIHMGVALYTAAWVLRGIMGLPPGATLLGVDALMLFIVVLGLLTGVYTMVGGLLAVVWTESAQTILLLVGAIVITVVGYLKVGGWTALVHTLASNPHPLAEVAGSNVTWGTSNFLNMARTAGDPSGLPWYSVLLGYPVLGIWYWCCDQTIVQRVLAARDEKQARLGPLFCAFLKIWPVFFFVLPGVIGVALVQQNAFGGAAPQTAADTYTFLITHLLPVGLKGLVTAAMLAAAMQTCSAALNSTATLVAYDLFKRHRPNLQDHQLVGIGRITTVVGTLLAIGASPLFGHYTTLFEGINKLISYIAPPITAVFLMGVFWKGASGRSAFLTLVAGMALGAVAFVVDWFALYKGDFMLIAFLLLAACVLILVVTSLLFPEPLKDEARALVWETWWEPLRVKCGSGLSDYRVVAAGILLLFVALYILFR